MNELEELTRLRDAVPLGVTRRAERLFHDGLLEDPPPVRRLRNPLTRIRPPWRLSLTVAAVAALVSGIVVAVLPSGSVGPARPAGPTALTAQLLADRASAAALAQPAVSPGQWVYRVVEFHRPLAPKGSPGTNTEAGWETADGGVTYGDAVSAGVAVGDNIPSYSELGSLPTSPAALDAYLAHLVYPNANAKPFQKELSAFSVIDDMLTNYVLPPRLQAEVYQALAIIPTVTVDSRVTAVDGRAGVAFVLPATPQSVKQEIILNASTYSFLGDAHWFSDTVFTEMAVKRMVIVGGPGSTRPSRTPPTAAELLAEEADRAVTFTNNPGPLFAEPGTWVLRTRATSSGETTVWATGDDSEQASYVNGELQVCSRSAACATSTQWLMPAGPSYTLVNPPYGSGRRFKGVPPSLPDSLPQLLAVLNTYRTGCADAAGDCNAVNALANMMFGYVNRGGANGNWFLMLADVPGVTVQPVTDVTGQADVAFRFPFTDGITEILLNASTHQLVGYVRNGVETVITKEVTVSGPGSLTPEGN